MSLAIWEFDIDETDAKQLVQIAKSEYHKAIIAAHGAKHAYYEAVESYVCDILAEKHIRPGMVVNIAFADGKEPCIYEGTNRGEIQYRSFSKKGPPYKMHSTTSWSMVKFITKESEEENGNTSD